jgi:translocation and assembly module TamB
MDAPAPPLPVTSRRMARRLARWLAAGVVVAAALGGGALVLTRTATGRARLLQALLPPANRLFQGRGTLHVRQALALGVRRIRLQGVELRDPQGRVLASVDTVDATLDWRALRRRAIHLRRLGVASLRVRMTQDDAGAWDLVTVLFGTGEPAPPSAPGWGDAVRIDTLALRDGLLTVVAPWAPHPVFTGAARDSVRAVRDSLHDLREDRPGHYLEQRMVVVRQGVLHDLILADPSGAPASMRVQAVDGTVTDPLLPIRNARGTARWTGDSLWFALDEVALPDSRGVLGGRIRWDLPGPVRYEVQGSMEAALADLRWAWDVMPAQGRGRARVRVRTLEDPDDLAVTLSGLDVASGRSRVSGDVEVVVRPADLLVRGMALDARPIESALVRRLSYGALPAAIQGVFAGRLVARRGGSLTAFPIDRLALAFDDARAGGARSSLVVRGTFLGGGRPGVRALVVERGSLALASLPPLAPTLPIVSGRLELAGSVRHTSARSLEALDVRMAWTDARGSRSAVRLGGDGRWTPPRRGRPVLEGRAVGRATLAIEALELAAVARVDSALPLRGRLRGQLAVAGSLDSLVWDAALEALEPASDGATVTSGGWVRGGGAARVDTGGFSGTGRLTMEALDVARWMGTAEVPATALDGTLAGTVTLPRSDGPATGAVALSLVQAPAPARPGLTLALAGALADSTVRVDSLEVAVAGVEVTARGALGRVASRSDTLVLSMRADSLAAVQRELDRLAAVWQPVDSAMSARLRALAERPVGGDLSLSGYLVGRVGDPDATVALGGRDLSFAGVEVGRLFGSARATRLGSAPTFEAAATADRVDGVGALEVEEVELRVVQPEPGQGTLTVDVSTRANASLRLRGGYAQGADSLAVRLDSIALAADGVTWRNERAARIRSAADGIQVAPVTLRSSAGGVLAVEADLPASRPISAGVQLDRFPVGDVGALVAGTAPFNGTVTGRVALEGTRDDPRLSWQLRADSLGVQGLTLPTVRSEGGYRDRRLDASALVTDSAGGGLLVRGQLPVELALRAVPDRILTDRLSGEVVLDSLRVGALGVAIPGVTAPSGILHGRVAVSGTAQRPAFDGVVRGNGLGARIAVAGIAPADGQFLLRAAGDSLQLEGLRLRSGGARDTLWASGVARFRAGEPASMRVAVASSGFQVARQRDGTELDLSGALTASGPVRHPTVRGTLAVPRANLVVDPLAASDALDLTSEAARALLGAEEVPVAESAARSLATLGRFVSVENARLSLGNEVWVQTPEARVKLAGELAATVSGDQLALEGEINAARGQYRLDLGVVSRSFAIDSGRVRFYGATAMAPTLDLTATHVVRVAGGGEIPVRVHIGGGYDRPVLTLGSSDPLYASAPESELISLLIFGAPTFALDGQSRSTVRAVTGVLLPSVGGAVEGALQRLLPVFNTVQVSTAGGQTSQELSALALLDNLSISAGKQIGDRTFLRLNTGICRGLAGDAAARGPSLWYGIAAEVRLRSGWLGQVGVDPGAAPCTRLGGDALPRMQFGFDLFREWIF